MIVCLVVGLLVTFVAFAIGFVAGVLKGKDVDVRITNRKVRNIRLERKGKR